MLSYSLCNWLFHVLGGVEIGFMDKNHDDQCARVKDPEMGLFSSANSYNQPTTRIGVICQFAENVHFISPAFAVSYKKLKNHRPPAEPVV